MELISPPKGDASSIPNPDAPHIYPEIILRHKVLSPGGFSLKNRVLIWKA